ASSFGCGCGSDRYVDTTDEVRCRFGRCKFFHPGYGGHKQTRSAPTRRLSSYPILAPAVGFEPTTNRLTADRSTTELRWITIRNWARQFCAADRSRQASFDRQLRLKIGCGGGI